jgi:hypothetical protein
VQRIYQDETRLALVLAHAFIKPFDMADDMFKVLEVIFDCERSGVFGWGERAVSVRLTEMNQRSDLSRGGALYVATNESINQRGFADAGYSFDDERVEWRYRDFSHD